MIQSMTGYGKTELQLPSKKITIEIKTLNSKNLDINVRVPLYYKEKELDVRKSIANHLKRGKVELGIYVESTGEEVTSQVNQEIVKNYINQLKEVADGTEMEYLKMAIRLPDSLKTTREEFDEEEWGKVNEGFENAIVKLIKYRKDEGRYLENDFNNRLNTLNEILEKIIKMDPERMIHIKDKIQKSLEEIQAKVDENRFEQELIYYLEKLDITEEKVRLKNHLAYFTKELKVEESNGKKLGFICQEIGREINTIGSKSNYASMQKLVVQMKDELEKIKEQVLNVL